MSDNSPEQSRNEQETAEQWRIVWDECRSGLYAFLKRRLGQEADVEDCLQAVSVKMIQQLRRSDSSVAPVARRAWLFRVASNEAARMWRSRAAAGRMMERQARDIDPSQSSTSPAIDKVILTETTAKVRQAIDNLPENYREVVQRRIDEDLTFQQIADELGIPLGTALTRMRCALDRIRNEIESQ